METLRDPLTGLYLRDKLFEVGNRLISSDIPFSVIIIDLDKFKLVNDVFGHIVGDSVLKHFTEFVQKFLRKNDVFVRYGGDEFIVLLPRADKEEARKVVNRIRTLIEMETLHSNPPVYLSFSVGIASHPQDGTCLEKLIEKADKNLYLEKKRQDRFEYFTQQKKFVNRIREMAIFRRTLTELDKGFSQVIVVEGEIGVGKSRFVEEGLKFAKTLGMSYLTKKFTPVDNKLPDFMDMYRKGIHILCFEDIQFLGKNDMKNLLNTIEKHEVPRGLILTFNTGGLSEGFTSTLLNLRKEGKIQWIKLKPLDMESTGELIEYQLSGGVSSELLKMIYDLSGGNPLLIESILQDCLNEGIIKKFGNFWYVKKEYKGVPEIVYEVVNTVFHKLDKNAKDIIVYSSFFGDGVFTEVFPYILKIDKDLIIDIFEKLVKEGWFIEISAGRFKFAKKILKYAVNNMISETRKREMYRKLVSVSDKVELPAETLSDLFYKSGKMRETFEYSLKAGEESFQKGEVKKAIKYLEIARKSSNTFKTRREDTVKLHKLLVECYLNLGEVSTAEDYLGFIAKWWDDHEVAFLRYKFNLQRGLLKEALKNLEDAIKKVKDPRKIVRYKIHRLGILIDLGDFGKASDEFKKLYKKVLSMGDKSLDIGICATVMDYRDKFEFENLNECVERFHVYLKDETLSTVDRILLYSSLGMYYFRETSKAIGYLKEALKIAREISDLLREGPILTNIGFVWLRHGYQKEATFWLEKAQEVYKKIGDLKGEIIILVDLGYAYSVIGRFAKAEEVLGEGIVKNDAYTKSDYLGFHLWHALIYNYIRAEEYKKALNAIFKLETIAKRLEGYMSGEADLYRGIVYLRTGEHEKASEIYKRAEPRSEDDFGYYFFLAEYLFTTGRYEKLIAELSKPLKLAEEYEFLWEKAQLLRFLGLGNLKLGKIEVAREYFEESISTFEKTNNLYEVRRTKELFGAL